MQAIGYYPARSKGPIDQIAVTPMGGPRRRSSPRWLPFTIWPTTAQRSVQSQITAAWSVAFTPDGQTLAVGGNDRVVRLYDVASGHFRGELPGHTHQVMALAFNREGTLLATASRGWLCLGPVWRGEALVRTVSYKEVR